jgi:hypothetical protein
MSEFTFHLRYKPGKDNVVADTLSRAPVEALADSYETLRELQLSDRFCRIALKALEEGKVEETLAPEEKRFMARIFSNCYVRGGCAFMKSSDPVEGQKELVLTPKKCRYELLRAAHAHRFSGHGGVAKNDLSAALAIFLAGNGGRRRQICSRMCSLPGGQVTSKPKRKRS